MASIVDIHAHLISSRYSATIARFGGSPTAISSPIAIPPTDKDDDVGARLAFMDDAGGAVQVLSPAVGAPYSEDEVQAVAAARQCNDEHAELVLEHTARIKAFISLPL